MFNTFVMTVKVEANCSHQTAKDEAGRAIANLLAPCGITHFRVSKFPIINSNTHEWAVFIKEEDVEKILSKAA